MQPIAPTETDDRLAAQKSRSLLVAITLALIVLSVSLVSWTHVCAAAEAIIKITNFTFDPAILTIKPGTTVKWTNADDTIHLVSEKDGKFRSPALDSDDSFSRVFDAPGTVEYFCVMHPQMTGKIIVAP